ncbi:MAG TPA: hypothetical protein VFW09_10415 [Solirubrobacteraceae bacterium]|nr:hypothetical protein [Solirubrobacteraceae bacterium]
MDAVLRDIVETFEEALGPFADPGVMRLAHALPETMEHPADLRVLMQVHRRAGVRARPALLTVVAERLVIAVPDGTLDEWPLADCAVQTHEPRIGGLRLTIRAADRTVPLQDAMPVDEARRLRATLAEVRGTDPVPVHPPVARLGSVAILYDDHIAFADAPTRALNPDVRARALELPWGTSTTLRSVSRLMQGARGRPRQVLIDGPGWTQIVPAPESAPELADAFADAVNRWAASGAERGLSR